MNRFLLLSMVMAYTYGACLDYCSNDFDSAAYCMNDGVVYPNNCVASCGHRQLQLQFACTLGNSSTLAACAEICRELFGNSLDKIFSHKNCSCPRVYNPICGSDKKTYTNECLMRCAGITKSKAGPCEAAGNPCPVDMKYKPVCGADGRVYANDKMAACAGVKIASQGECIQLNSHMPDQNANFQQDNHGVEEIM